MKLFQRLRAIWDAPIRGITPPKMSTRALAGGRVTADKETLYNWNTAFVTAPPDYESDWRMMTLDDRTLSRLSPGKLLEMMADLSPEISSALWYFLRLCNPGWEATALRPGTETQDTRAQAAIDAFFAQLRGHYGALDVVFGRLFMGVFLRGAVFGEIVMDEAGRLPVDIATPDPYTVRFAEEPDPVRGIVHVPGQWQNGLFVRFVDEAVRYVPVDPLPGKPYGRPLVSPALFTSLFLLSMMRDLKRVIQQQGYPRLDIGIDFTALAEAMPQEASRSGWADDVRRAIEAAYAALEPDDAFVHDANITVNRPVGTVDADSLGAVDALIKGLERMAARALKTMPFLFGIYTGGSEVQANRQWEVQAAGIKALQHLVENTMEHWLGLALQAQGMRAVVRFRFAELRAAEMLRDAQTEQLRIDNATKKYLAGWISQDEASEEITGHKADAPTPRQGATGAQWQAGADLSEDRAGWIAELRTTREALNQAQRSRNGHH